MPGNTRILLGCSRNPFLYKLCNYWYKLGFYQESTIIPHILLEFARILPGFFFVRVITLKHLTSKNCLHLYLELNSRSRKLDFQETNRVKCETYVYVYLDTAHLHKQPTAKVDLRIKFVVSKSSKMVSNSNLFQKKVIKLVCSSCLYVTTLVTYPTKVED